MKQTILMNVFDSNMVRNIMRTDVLKTLEASDEVGRIIILVHHTKVDEYREEFASAKVTIDAYPPNTTSRKDIYAWFVGRHLIHTTNVRLKIEEIRDRARGSALGRYVKYAGALFIYYSSMFPPLDFLYRRLLIAYGYDEHLFDGLIEKYRPDFVFLPTIFGANDVRLLKYCKAHNIPNVGMIKSWDNLLGKDPLLVWPDRLIVHNGIVKGYATSMHDYPEDRIFISGLPQFDVYADPNFPTPREKFFADLGLDPGKKLVLYSCMGGWISLHEKSVVELLADIVNKSGELDFDAQLLVRLHPAYLSEDKELRKIPNIVVTRPGIPSAARNPERFDFEFHQNDTKELAATLKYADVILNSGSTMAIDAACFDTPIINIAFDGYVENEPFERSARRLVGKEHYAPIVATGGVRVVNNRAELVDDLNRYLHDRSLEHEGRMRIVEEQCYKMDGQSGQRIGEYILRSMQELAR